MFKYVVVGKGMFGSAAAKYLSIAGDGVAAIGPDEPVDFKLHNGVFGSHYDAGRITRILDTEYVWALAAKRSIETYPIIEEKSGIRFFHPVGCIKVVNDAERGRVYIDANEANGKKLGAATERLTSDDLKLRWGFLNLPENSIAISERGTAGWIDPRKLVAAQILIAKLNGAEIINDTIIDIKPVDGVFELKTLAGNKHRAEKVLVTAGGFANFNNLLPRKLDLKPRAETVVLARLSYEQALELDSMPTTIWFLDGRENLRYVYVVPPVQYPDGKYYIKMGGDREVEHEFLTLDKIKDWFHSDGGQEATADFKEIIQSLLPGVVVEQWLSKPCLITDTATDRPYIDSVENGLFVATGGCGAAAKSSDEFGRLAALCAQGNHDPSYGEKAFQAIFEGSAEPLTPRREFSF